MAEITFEAVFRDELAIISKRREAEGRAVINGTSGPHTSLGLTGLALSGGGVRSATFALGVVQALIAHGVFRHIDYLSTVSGGGYLGVCVSNWFAQAKASVDPPLLSSRGNSDPPAIAHLRDHASYLAPRGRSKLFTLIVSVGIGLFINVTLLLPILILLAILFQFYVSFLLVKMDHPFTYTVAGFSIWHCFTPS
jgi:Patatin-like phospholipase